MFAKKLLVAAAAILAAYPAFASDLLAPDSVSVDYATSAKVRMERLSVQKDWNVHWFESNGTHLDGYFDLTAGTWQEKQYKNVSGAKRDLWDIGLDPVFRWENVSKKGIYYEGGIGVHRLSNLYNNDTYRLSTLFQFGDHIGVGYVFNNNWEVGAKVEHFSNGGYRKPNTGINFFDMKVAYHF